MTSNDYKYLNPHKTVGVRGYVKCVLLDRDNNGTFKRSTASLIELQSQGQTPACDVTRPEITNKEIRRRFVGGRKKVRVLPQTVAVINLFKCGKEPGRDYEEIDAIQEWARCRARIGTAAGYEFDASGYMIVAPGIAAGIAPEISGYMIAAPRSPRSASESSAGSPLSPRAAPRRAQSSPLSAPRPCPGSAPRAAQEISDEKNDEGPYLEPPGPGAWALPPGEPWAEPPNYSNAFPPAGHCGAPPASRD